MGYLGCLGQAQEGGGGSGLTSEVATAADKSAKNVNTMYRQSTLLAYQRHTHFMYNRRIGFIRKYIDSSIVKQILRIDESQIYRYVE